MRLRFRKGKDRTAAALRQLAVAIAARRVIQPLADDAHNFHTTWFLGTVPSASRDEEAMRVAVQTHSRRARVRYAFMILHTVPAGPGLALFKIEGELDFAGAHTVRSALVRAADASRYGRMVIDLADVKTADEKGIASLANAVRKLLVAHRRCASWQ